MTAKKPKRLTLAERTRHVLIGKPATKVKPTKVKPTEPPNKLFPGRPRYVGPQKGYFAMLHHQQLFEETTSETASHRADYVKHQKPSNEVDVRLHNMMYLGHCPHIKILAALYKADRMCLGKTYELRRPIEQAIEATKRHIRKPVIEYIAQHIPDHSWDEGLNTIKGT